MANLYRNFVNQPEGKAALLPVAITGTLDKPITPVSVTFVKNLDHVELDAPILLTSTTVVDVPNKATADGSLTPSIVAAGDVVGLATLAQSITPVLTGVGQYGQNATLDKPLSLTLASAATGSVTGTLQRTINTLHPITSVGVADVQPHKGALAKAVTLVLTGQGQLNSGILDTLISTLTVASTTTQLSALRGIADMPAFTGAAVLEGQEGNSVTLPAFTGNAVSFSTSITIATMVLPSFIGQATTGHTSKTTLPKFTGNARIENGNSYISMTTLPSFIGDAVLEPDLSARSETTLPSFTGTSEVVSVSDAQSVVNLPALTGDSVALAGVEHIGIATLPSFIGDAIMQSGQFIISVTTLPAFVGNAVTDNGGVLAVTTHVFNTENMAATEYSNYDFLAMAMFNGVPVGISSAGVFELSGSDDDGVDIAVDVLSGFSDLGTEDLKRMSNVYLGYKSDGDIQVQVSIDGEPAVRTYTVAKISNTTGIKRGRAKPGKGLKSKYWQVGVKNVLGSDLELNDLGLYVEQFNRKVQ